MTAWVVDVKKKTFFTYLFSQFRRQAAANSNDRNTTIPGRRSWGNYGVGHHYVVMVSAGGISFCCAIVSTLKRV